jgi:hypothetical protein
MDTAEEGDTTGEDDSGEACGELEVVAAGTDELEAAATEADGDGSGVAAGDEGRTEGVTSTTGDVVGTAVVVMMEGWGVTLVAVACLLAAHALTLV